MAKKQQQVKYRIDGVERSFFARELRDLDKQVYANAYPALKPFSAPIDLMIGRLDRLLSEFLLACDEPRDEADRQTLKHHARDLIGVGQAALQKIQK